MYSSGNPTNIANPIQDVSVQIDIKAAGGRLTLFQTSLCEIHCSEHFEEFQEEIDPKNYLNAYNVQDIQLICCQDDASTLWLIPPVVKDRYITSLVRMDIVFTWIFTRERPKGKEAVKSETSVGNLPTPIEVIEVLNGTAESFPLTDAYPRYFRVTSSGEVRRLEQTDTSSVSGNLFLNRGSPPWWSFYDFGVSNMSACNGLTGPMAVVVSEETPRMILNFAQTLVWCLFFLVLFAVYGSSFLYFVLTVR